MRVYFVRHAERAGDPDEAFLNANIPLTKYGRSQAKMLASRFKNIPIEAIYCSPYLRTRQTADIINKVIKTKIHFDQRIEELGPEEDLAHVFFRAMEFVEFLETRKEKYLLVSAHGGIIKMIVCALVFRQMLPEKIFEKWNDSFHTDFTGITLCVYQGKLPWRVVTWNDLGHLPPDIED